MRRTAIAAAVLLALTACSSAASDTPANTSADVAPTSTAATPAETTAAATTTPLEGSWTTDLTRDQVIAYIRAAGWSKETEKALLAPDMAGPAKTEFRLDFVGDYFRMAQVATDTQWQSGTFRLEDGRLHLDDEAPVGEFTVAAHVDGDTVTFDDPGGSGPDGKFIGGAPAWAPGAVIWGATAWTREGS